MPELPEVEIYRRYFAAHALHQTIARVRVLDERILGQIRTSSVLGPRSSVLTRGRVDPRPVARGPRTAVEKFASALRGRSFREVRRHGKHLFADAGRLWLHLHFGMTGDLSYYRDADPRFARVVFDFRGGAHLAFEDMRLFGVADLTPSPEAYIDEHRLGPDPLDAAFTLGVFRQLLASRRGAIKSLLMSQDVIAGVGNLYCDETLFQAGIHPRHPVDELSDGDVRKIHGVMTRILRDITERKARGASYPPRYLVLHREEGARCPRCGGTIRRTVVFGRTTYFCGKHQD